MRTAQVAMSHPTRRLDDSVHQRTRLGILTILNESGRADFNFLRQTLELTDGNLSANLSKLESLGYIEIDKRIEGTRPRTWLTLTRAGRAAFTTEIEALREIVAGVEASSDSRFGIAPA